MNLVLFRCRLCNSRFPTFHPKHKPDFELDATKMCKIDVDPEDFDVMPEQDLLDAPVCTGVCKVCKIASVTAQKSADLQGILTFF